MLDFNDVCSSFLRFVVFIEVRHLIILSSTLRNFAEHIAKTLNTQKNTLRNFAGLCGSLLEFGNSMIMLNTSQK